MKYQVVKVKNNAGISIKAYEYIKYGAMNPEQTALANYFYFRPYKLNLNADVSDDATGAAAIASFLSSSYTLPTAEDISNPNGEHSFGTLKNNAIELESAPIEGDPGEEGEYNNVRYYLLAYCVTGLPSSMLGTSAAAADIYVNPVITIGQANGPNPQTTSSDNVLYADTWQALRTQISLSGMQLLRRSSSRKTFLQQVQHSHRKSLITA